MLCHLSINNIAIIDKATVEFTEGFNVLTGETAAGKSIIIDSINMVLGERTTRDLIRHGESKAVVEAMFVLENEEAIALMEQLGIEIENNELILRREMTTDGRSVCRANGQLITASVLKSISKNLMNIHGQHDNQQLLMPAKHIEFLDRYAGIENEKAQYKEVYEERKKVKEQLEALYIDEAEKQRKIDMLAYQIDEIEAAKLKVNEEEELKEQQVYLSNIEKISGAVHSSYEKLYNSDSSVHDSLSIVKRNLESVSSYDKRLEDFYTLIDQISINLDDLVYQLRDFLDEEDYDAEKIEKVENRLNLIYGLKRKYGSSVLEILNFLEQARNDLQQITNLAQQKEHLEMQQKKCDEKVEKYALIITKKRLESAKELEKRIMLELSDLEMKKVKFSVELTSCEFNINGSDKVEFLISTNQGEPLKPLARIASGGELSRIMLAIQSILADTDMVDTLIFDEIDTGISGRTAYKTAEKIAAIARKKQVICITHLAQIACIANTHFVIKKDSIENETKTTVLQLSRDGRKVELARIMGGAQITELTLQSAEEMLELAEKSRVSS